jgi:DNA-binding XRE family transcriptional regulator
MVPTRDAFVDWDISCDDLYDEDGFYKQFIADINAARFSVVVFSGWAKLNRLRYLKDTLLQLPSRGIRVCVFVQMPRNWKGDGDAIEAASNRDLESVIELLEQRGIHVNLVRKIHKKIGVIDGCILWLGSLNILSHYDTEELMLRKVDPVAALAVIKRNVTRKCVSCHEARKPIASSVSLSDFLEDVGKNLSDLREKAGYSRTELSEATGVSRWRVARIEKNEAEPTAREIYALLTALGREVGIQAPGTKRYFAEIDSIAYEAVMRSNSMPRAEMMPQS